MPLPDRFCAFALASVLLLSLAPSAARAEWLPNGTPVASPAGPEFFPRLAPDGRGGAFVVWEDTWANVQHFTTTGECAAGWPTFGRVVSKVPQRAQDRYAVLAPDGEGGVYVVWYMSGEGCVAHCVKEPVRLWVQRLTATGAVASDWPPTGILVEEACLEWPAYEPAAAPDGNHGVLIAWGDSRIVAQDFGPGGTRRWGTNGVVVCQVPQTKSQPVIMADDAGGGFVFWGDHRSSGPASRIFGQHISDRGKPSWTVDGVPISASPVLVQGFLEGPPAAVSDGAGGAIAAWAGTRGSDFGVFAARVTRGGGLPWKGDVPLCTTPGEKNWMRLVALDGGGAAIAWIDSRRAPFGDVYAQRITHSGRTVWTPNGVPVCTAPGSRGPLTLASDGSDGAYVAWGDSRPQGELYAMRLTGGGAPAPGWPVDGALVSERLPTLDPYSYGFGALAMTAVRGREASERFPLQREARWKDECERGGAIVAWQDVRPAPNGETDLEQSFAMLLTPDGPAVSPGATGIVPLAAPPPRPHDLSFALRRVQPNPASSRAVVRFALPDAAPATLELFDLAGRRLWSREVGSLGPGEHDVPLGDGERFPPGVYLVRLAQGVRTATVRLALLH